MSLPTHIAIIMDGNGRWAKQKGKLRVFGHENGTKSVREITEACAELHIENLTLYAFSTENWNRPKEEVDGLELWDLNVLNQTKSLENVLLPKFHDYYRSVYDKINTHLEST